jgi:hypothetical protein
MTIIERLREAITDAGIDNVFMYRAPDIPECVTITPYMSSPLTDIPMSRESFQIAVRSDDCTAAKVTAWEALRAIESAEPGAEFHQTPTFLGLEDGRALFVFNLDVIASWDELTEERQG